MSKRNGKGRDKCFVPFHIIISSGLTTGTASFLLQPSATWGSRVLAAADEWAHFRVKSLKFRAHRTSSITATQVVGFVGGVQDTPPATSTDIAQLLPSVILTTTTTVPTEWCSVSPSELAGPFPWYKSVAGAADATEESPGYMCVAGTGSEVYFIEARGVFEFKTSVATANTPAELALMLAKRSQREAEARSRARQQLLRVLDPVSTPLSSNGVRPAQSGETSSVPPSDALALATAFRGLAGL